MKKILVLFCSLVLATSVFAKNIVITSIQPLYSIASYVTKGTDIEVYSAFDSSVSMTTSRETMREENFDLSIAKKAQAVIDIAKVWPEDSIFGKARSYNIHLIEIDASFPYNEKDSRLYFSDLSNGKANPYVWTGTKNAIKMANIIAKDLIRIYPKNKNKILKNVGAFSEKMINIENKADKELLNSSTTEVISLSENLQYFLNDLNIYAEYEDYKSITKENVAKLMEEKGIKTIVSDRWLKKDIIKVIKEAGGSFVVINTLDIPLDLDGKMDPDALVKAYQENVENLLEALNK